jgi:hypothetical protein
MTMVRPITATLLVLVAAFAFGLGGCSNPSTGFHLGHFAPEEPADPAPTPNSPAAALRLLEWCYNNRSCLECRDLFTDDYRFVFSSLDSAGVDYRATPWTRDDELIYMTHLLCGGSPSQPTPVCVRLAFDKNFLVFPDPDYVASDPQGRWHVNIRTQLVFNARFPDGNVIDVSGAANFYFVRGDSAMIPEESRMRGVGPDSTRWWIRRWVDETAEELRAVAAPASVLAPQPASNRTWGGLKVLYR